MTIVVAVFVDISKSDFVSVNSSKLLYLDWLLHCILLAKALCLDWLLHCILLAKALYLDWL